MGQAHGGQARAAGEVPWVWAWSIASGLAADRQGDQKSSVSHFFFSEDLASDAIAFSMAAIKGLRKEDVRKACKGFADINIRKNVSYCVWDNMP